jgi:rhodanese-related sulfurtransferase
MHILRATELAQWLADGSRPAPVLLDVREGWEFALGHLPQALHIPMSDLPQRHHELAPDQPTVVICHHGVRSYRAALWLEQQGFSALFNLEGGTEAWSTGVDATLPRY